MAQVWTPPTISTVKVPQVTPGKSGGREIAGDFPLDQTIIEQFPPGTQVHSCEKYGCSEWTVSAKIATTLANGEAKFYFLKNSAKFCSEALHVGEAYVPSSSPDAYYFLCDFIQMKNGVPDPEKLCSKLIQMHQSSKSPTGKFGFHINTCQGNLPQDTKWNSSWVDLFIQLVRHSMRLNREKNGTWKNLGQVVDRLITHVVPQVLGPLEAEGRVVKPTLIHGDLWDGNVGIDEKTGEIYAFDASVYYAHYEMEIAM